MTTRSKKTFSKLCAIFLLTTFLLLGLTAEHSLGFQVRKASQDAQMLEISPYLSISDFENIKNFILTNGDRKTIFSHLQNNPHYNFNGVDAYLKPTDFRLNINCDPDVSDYDSLVLILKDGPFFNADIIRQMDYDPIMQAAVTTPLALEKNTVYLRNIYAPINGHYSKYVIDILEAIKNEVAQNDVFNPRPNSSEQRYLSCHLPPKGSLNWSIINQVLCLAPQDAAKGSTL